MNFLTNKSTIGEGEIRFFDAIEPPLKAGKYTLTAQQSIENVPNPDGPDVPQYAAAQDLLVTGPQFSINPTIIHSVYPPALKTGSYHNDLPNLVMTDFALPWSRPIDPEHPEANPNTPWMGLLTIYPEEMSTAIIDGPKNVSISDLITNKTDDILRPALVANDIGLDLTTSVRVIDMDISTFQAISPTLEELPFLAHGREVNTAGKVMLGMEGDGYFSLLIGNRIPKAGTATEAAENHIFIVSYEGLGNYLRGGSPPPAGKSKVRLVFLGSWKFNASEAKGSFLSMMSEICDKGRGGVKLMQMPGVRDAISDQTATDALTIGYTALQNDMRVGEQATSWYRGPAVPYPTKRIYPIGNPYLYSDHAMLYDPGTGIFNHAYSAAWQVGRLLALSDGTFARGLFMWRNNYINEVNRQAAQQNVTANAAKLSGETPSESDTPLTPYEGLRAAFAGKIKDVEWRKYTARNKRVLGAHLPGVLDDSERQVVMDNDEDPLLAILKK